MSKELYEEMYKIYKRFPMYTSSINVYCRHNSYPNEFARARALSVVPRYYETRLAMLQEEIDELNRYKKALEEFILNVTA